jgi:hypothetical protein
VIVAGVIALIVLAGGGVAGLVYVNRQKSNTPSAANSAGAPSAPTTGTKAVKYKVAVLPDDLCTVVQLGHLATAFETENSAPSHQRNVTAGTGTASCSIVRLHGAAARSMSLVSTALVFTDTAIAIAQQKQAVDDANANKDKITTVTGVGDEAIIAPFKLNSSADTTVAYTEHARDGNLWWTVTITETNLDRGAWTDADRQQVIDDLAASVRATHKKLIS